MPKSNAPKRRSPELVRGVNGRKGGNRTAEQNRPPGNDFRDGAPSRRRDEYWTLRSPSPRAFRGNRSPPPGRYDRRERRRSRSPPARGRRFRSPSPRPRSAYESDADLPVPRRSPWEVPDVQVLVLEDVDRLVWV